MEYLVAADDFLLLLCWEHFEKLTKGIGLKLLIPEETLMARFELVYKNSKNLWVLKALKDIYSFFKDDQCRRHLTESLGSYTIKHINLLPFDFDCTVPKDLLGNVRVLA